MPLALPGLRYLPPQLVLGLPLLALTAWTWQSWPDILVDFGREAWLAQQIAGGRMLYRDLAYLAGPLSPYVNSIVVRVFGASLLALAAVNLVVLGAIVAMLYMLLLRAGDRLGATLACLVLLSVFAFGQLQRIGNYNFLCPYAHEMTHGMALSLLALLLLVKDLERPRLMRRLGSGLAVGLVFLTKPEIFVAAAGALLVGLVGSMVLGSARGAWPALRGVLVFLLGAVVPPVAALLLLRCGLPARDALRGMLGGWAVLAGGDVASLPFFKRGMGLDVPGTRLAEMALWLGGFAIVYAAAALLSWLAGRRATWPGPLALGFGVALCGGLVLAGADLVEGVRPLPVIIALVGVAAALAFLRARRARRVDEAARHLGALVLIVFAGLLLAKIVLYVRVFHYGFALAMPATLVLVVAIVSWVPAWIERRGRDGRAGTGAAMIFQAAGLALVLAAMVGNLRAVGRTLSHKTQVVGTGANAIRTLPDDRGELVASFLRDLDQIVPAGCTLACLPEGAMLNFQTRRLNPTPFVDFNPLEVLVYGEDRMIAAFEAAPPDFIALVHKDTSEFGAAYFGRDYGQTLFAWIMERYAPVAQLGARPLTSKEFGILLMERREVAVGGGGP